MTSRLQVSSAAPPEAVETWPLGAEHIEIASRWLAEDTNARWLDFGGRDGRLTPMALHVMAQRDQHCIWVYGPPGERTPVGLVALGNIHARYRTAETWCVLGEKAYGQGDLTIRAASRLLEHAFRDLALHSVYAWTVEINRGGRRLLERTGFRYAGRLRESHRIDERCYDRLWFDLLAREFRGYGPHVR